MSEEKKFKVVGEEIDDAAISVPKPEKFSLNKFKSEQGPTAANVETLLTGLPHHSISQAKDYARLHPDEKNYWSPELCFVNVPIKGQKRDTLHLINEALAKKHLPPAKILRFRLALATKPHDIFFLCHVPTRNTDNSWNEVVSRLRSCGPKQPVSEKKVTTNIRLTQQKMQMPSPNRNGRHKRLKNSSAQHLKVARSRRKIIPACCV